MLAGWSILNEDLSSSLLLGALLIGLGIYLVIRVPEGAGRALLAWGNRMLPATEDLIAESRNRECSPNTPRTSTKPRQPNRRNGRSEMLQIAESVEKTTQFHQQLVAACQQVDLVEILGKANREMEKRAIWLGPGHPMPMCLSAMLLTEADIETLPHLCRYPI